MNEAVDLEQLEMSSKNAKQYYLPLEMRQDN